MTGTTLSLHTLFVEARPDELPVCHDGQRIVCWREFVERVERHRAGFAQRPERRWLLDADHPLTFVVLLFALLHAGKEIVVPPNALPGTRERLSGTFDAIAGQDVPTTTGDPVALTALAPRATIIDLYTSGSTGEPKRVRKSLLHFEAEVRVLESLWGEALGATTIISTVPHQHFYGLLFRLFWPLAARRCFDVLTCAHPDAMTERAALFGDCVLVSSPAHLSRLPELLALDSPRPFPRIVFSSGGPLPASAAAEYRRQRGAAPTEVFGSTETGGIAWRQQDGNDEWTPFPGMQIDTGPDGALILGSPFLSPELAADATTSRLRLDDAVELRADGRFRLLGRLDRTVKIEEKRLSLPELETRMKAHPWARDAAATALGGRRQQIGAALVLNAEGRAFLANNGRRATVQAIRRELSAHFEDVLLPRRWRFPEQLPISERGKLSHAAIAALFDERLDPPHAPGPSKRPTPTMNRPLPEVLATRHDDGATRMVLELGVTPDLNHFPGHFPGFPVLPGVVQIDWAVHFAQRHLGLSGQFVTMEGIKFQSLLLPDTRVELALSWDEARGRLEFSFAAGKRKFSSGCIVFGEAQRTR